MNVAVEAKLAGEPGPIAAQLGQGMLWSLFTIAGIAIGITVYARLQARSPQHVAQARKRRLSQSPFRTA